MWRDWLLPWLFPWTYWTIILVRETALFNLDWWLWILTHHKNPLINLWQIPPEWCERLNYLHHQTAPQSHQKSLRWQLIRWLMNSQLYVNDYPMICLFLLSEQINFRCYNTNTEDQFTRPPWYHQNKRFWKHLIQPTMDLKNKMEYFHWYISW